MLKLFLASLLAAFAVSSHANPVITWQEGSVIGVTMGNSKHPRAVFGTTGLNLAGGNLNDNAGRWNTVDVTQLGVPITAKSVFLSGVLIITHGTTPEQCDLWFTARAVGDQLPWNDYQGQTIEPHVGGGQRSTMSLWVPVVNGKFEYYWKGNTEGAWPTNCAYGVNLSLQAYVR